MLELRYHRPQSSASDGSLRRPAEHRDNRDRWAATCARRQLVHELLLAISVTARTTPRVSGARSRHDRSSRRRASSDDA